MLTTKQERWSEYKWVICACIDYVGDAGSLEYSGRTVSADGKPIIQTSDSQTLCHEGSSGVTWEIVPCHLIGPNIFIQYSFRMQMISKLEKNIYFLKLQ